MPKYKRMPEVDEEEKQAKPGRKEFREDVSDAVSSALKKGKKKGKKVLKNLKGKKKGKSGKYDDFSSKELYQLVKQKRDQVLAKKGIPAKIPRGRAKLIEICRKIKV